MCNVIEVETQNNLQYVFFPVSSSALRLKVKAVNDAHIALTNGNFENDPMTELHIGGWDNTKSIVRRNRREPDKVKVETPRILDRSGYVGMWIRWHDGYIAAGLEGSETPFMSYLDPQPHPINHAAVRTGWGSTGSWKIEVSPVLFKPLTLKPLGGELHWVGMTSSDEVPLDAVVGGFEQGEVLFVARANHNQSMRPGKYVPSLKHAYITGGHRVHKKDRFEILCGYNLMWVKMKGDCLPPHAFPGGSAFERNNEVLYIGRTFIENNLIPVSPLLLKPLAPKPLRSGELHWLEMTSNDQIPFGAVVGGFENGETLYIARAIHNHSMCPGKYVPSAKHAFVAWGHRAHKKDNFQILCGYNLTWHKTRNNVLPPNAFPAGNAAETNNEVLYIGRAIIGNTNLIPGKVHLHYRTCFIPYNETEREVTVYEVLVTPDKLYGQQIYYERDRYVEQL